MLRWLVRIQVGYIKNKVEDIKYNLGVGSKYRLIDDGSDVSSSVRTWEK